jgi:hypothetical protein
MSQRPENRPDAEREDPLLQRYREANEHDPARPQPALRAAVLTHARAQIPAMPLKLPQTAPANDSRWQWRALGSLAVMGLVGLLVMQFDRGTAEEKALALGDAQAPRESAAAPSSTAKPVPAPPAPQATGDSADAARASPAPAPASSSAEPVQPEPDPAPPRQTTRAAPMAKAEPMAPAEKPEAIAAAPGLQSMQDMVSIDKAQAPEAMARAEQAAAFGAPDNALPDHASAPALRERADNGLGPARQAPDPSFSTDGQAGAARGATLAGLPPLHAAAASGQLSAVRSLLAQGVDVNARDSQGRTALMWAAMGHHQNVWNVLMNAGANPALRDGAGQSASDLALREGHADWLTPGPKP